MNAILSVSNATHFENPPFLSKSLRGFPLALRVLKHSLTSTSGPAYVESSAKETVCGPCQVGGALP